jgi:hypothetical protein
LTGLWGTSGNAGSTAGVNFPGTTDNQPLEIKVNGQRTLRLEDNGTVDRGVPNVIGGSRVNFVAGNVVGATIGGGGSAYEILFSFPNRVTRDFGTVVGGLGNTASGFASTAMGYSTTAGGFASTAMGYFTTASGDSATVGGGSENSAYNDSATVSGGFHNSAIGRYATVGGGFHNTAIGNYATVGGGYTNTAYGDFSTASGTRAYAAHAHSFVWSGRAPNDPPSYSTAVGRFHINAWNGLAVDYSQALADGTGSRWFLIGATTGGQAISTWTGAWLSDGGAWINNSDRQRKDGFADVDAREILDKVAALPIQTWHYSNELAEVRHLGPVAQDFHAAFGLGSNEKSIGTVDADGVALAAIQGLNQKVEEKDAEIRNLRTRLEKIEQILSGQLNTSEGK